MNTQSAFRIFPFVIAVVILSCSDDPVSGGYVAPPLLYLEQDTVFGTLQDPVLIEAIVTGAPALEPQAVDFGDGQQQSDMVIAASKAAAAHLYSAKGVYTVVYSAGAWADTCIAVIQDYVRPSEATSVTLTISGAEVEYIHHIRYEETPEEDSSWVTYEDTYAFALRAMDLEQQPVFFPWENRQRCKYYYFPPVPLDSGETVSHTAFITLTPDGAGLARLAYISSTGSVRDSAVTRTESTTIEIVGLDLDPAMTPSRTDAKYTWTGGYDDFLTRMRLIEYSSELYGIGTTETRRLVRFNAEGEITITVEFTDR